MLNSGRTFPVYFSSCPSESTESIGFGWEGLKLEVFIPGKVSPPRVVLGDWVGGLVKSVALAFPDAYFQGCDWHAAQAMLKWYKHKDRDYATVEIEGVRARAKVAAASGVQAHAHVEAVSGLYDLSWTYI